MSWEVVIVSAALMLGILVLGPVPALGIFAAVSIVYWGQRKW